MATSLRLLALLSEDDEMLLLSSLSRKEYTQYNEKFDLEELTNVQCQTYFRFDKADLKHLASLLQIPAKIVCRNGTICSGIEGMCILLRRLSYPNRLEDISPLFCRSIVELSYILNEMFDFMYNTHNVKLERLDQNWITSRLDMYTDAIHENGAPLDKCWGFIDGTVRPICRPNKNQQVVFSGHKRVHGLKFQSVVTPDGMIANLFGSIEGKRHDAGMLRESGLLDQLERHMATENGTIYSLYGDLAYPLRSHLIAPFKSALLTAEEKEFNKLMAPLRTSVEWMFGNIINMFAFLDYKKNLKLYLQPVAKYYHVGALLTNCHTCLYGNEVSSYFGLEPPSLEVYLNDN